MFSADAENGVDIRVRLEQNIILYRTIYIPPTYAECVLLVVSDYAVDIFVVPTTDFSLICETIVFQVRQLRATEPRPAFFIYESLSERAF